MKKVLFAFLGALLFLVFSVPVFATSGACSGHGGVNCAAGPDSDGSVICNDGWTGSSVSYSSMSSCSGYTTTYSIPTYTNPTYTTCPSNSTYSYLYEECQCNYGYEVDENDECVQEQAEVPASYESDSSVSVFSDMYTFSKHYDAIYYLYNLGIIEGYADGTFKPNNSLNRAEMLKILIEGKGIEVPDSTHCFNDIADDWYAPYVCYAKSAGWIEGYSDGTFRPAQNVNKVEAIKMLLNSQEIAVPTSVSDDPFTDVSATDWFASYISKANEMGILEEAGSTFSPAADMTRGNIAESLYRLIKD